MIPRRTTTTTTAAARAIITKAVTGIDMMLNIFYTYMHSHILFTHTDRGASKYAMKGWAGEPWTLLRPSQTVDKVYACDMCKLISMVACCLSCNIINTHRQTDTHTHTYTYIDVLLQLFVYLPVGEPVCLCGLVYARPHSNCAWATPPSKCCTYTHTHTHRAERSVPAILALINYANSLNEVYFIYTCCCVFVTPRTPTTLPFTLNKCN